MSDPARVIVVDCPWQPRDSLPGKRGASHKYSTMSVAELCALDLPARQDRHVLFFWRLASMLPEALQVLSSWGYVPASEIVWRKLRPCAICCATGAIEVHLIEGAQILVPAVGPCMRACVRACHACDGEGGTPYMGLGHYVRGAHEVAIIAHSRRNGAPDRVDKSVLSVFSAPMLVDVDGLVGERGRIVHSAKPDYFFEIVERLYPGPRVELFSRRTRPGWRSEHSNEADKLDDVARIMREVWPLREREDRLAKARR